MQHTNLRQLVANLHAKVALGEMAVQLRHLLEAGELLAEPALRQVGVLGRDLGLLRHRYKDRLLRAVVLF